METAPFRAIARAWFAGTSFLFCAVVISQSAENKHAANDKEVLLREAVAGRKLFGEPYALQGHRLAFTDWSFIRPGSLFWLNERNEVINEVEEGSKRPVYGEWSAQINRPSSPFGIRLEVQAAERRGPVLKRERPWEREYVIFKTVLKDGDLYRAWGKSLPGGDCYFESRDGVTWERPNLGQKEFEGSRNNNLLSPGPGGTVFIDPAAGADGRFKGIFGPRLSFEAFRAFIAKYPDRWETKVIKGDWGDPARFHALQGAVSPDGVRWSVLPEPFTIEHTDGMETGYFDVVRRKYVIYTRNWLVRPRSPEWTGDLRTRTWLGELHGSGRRAIGRMESDTFGGFSLSEPVIVPVPGETSPSEVFYTSIRTTIPGAPDHHLMFPTIWDTRDDTTTLGLWSSHDGIGWNRLPGPPVLATAAHGQWDGGCIFSFPHLFELPNGDFALPYKGYNLPHKYPRGDMELYSGYAVWPKGRLIAVVADEAGEFSTVGILPPGRTLKVNALTKRAGGLRFDLARLDDRAIPGRSFADCDVIQGDAHRAVVKWKGEADLKTRAGEGLVIRVRMERARLFGLEFE